MKNTRQTVGRVIIILLALTGVALYLLLGSVSVSVRKDSVTVRGTLSKEITLSYNDIKSCELRNQVDTGTCSFGLGTRKISIGQYSSPTYGPYHLLIYKNVEKFILLETEDTAVIFNCISGDETVECFEEISEAIQNWSVQTPSEGGEAS